MKTLSPIPPSWRPFLVPEMDHSSTLGKEFQRHLDDAKDERPLQLFLMANRTLLTPLLPLGVGAWVWDRPQLGSEFVPDFLLCTRNCAGCHWLMLEIESPKANPLLKNGLPGAKLREAQGQIQDWRIWIRDNISYAQTQLGFQGLTAEAQAVIVIGRRSAIDTKHAKKWREINTNDTRIMTYDRLMDTLKTGRTICGDTNG